jgi:hypothetical protein
MSRYIDYLNENKEEEILEILWRDCKPFLNEHFKSKTSMGLLYRGSSSKSVKDIRKINVRKNREPRDVNILIHNIFNDLFQEKFGWKARSEGVFVVANKKYSSIYGKSHIFFPIGNYEYLWNPDITDLFGKLLRDPEIRKAITGFVDLYGKSKKEQLEELLEIKKKDFKRIVDGYINYNLIWLIEHSSPNEIIFKCDKYYLINTRYEGAIKEKLKKQKIEKYLG